MAIVHSYVKLSEGIWIDSDDLTVTSDDKKSGIIPQKNRLGGLVSGG